MPQRWRCANAPRLPIGRSEALTGEKNKMTLEVEDLAFVVGRAPEIHPLASDPDHHLVQVPAIARPRTVMPQPLRDHRSEFQYPIADALVGEVEPTLCKQLLNVAIAQGEAQVEPNRVLNHGRREPVPAIRDRKHGSQPTAGRQLWPKLS